MSIKHSKQQHKLSSAAAKKKEEKEENHDNYEAIFLSIFNSLEEEISTMDELMLCKYLDIIYLFNNKYCTRKNTFTFYYSVYLVQTCCYLVPDSVFIFFHVQKQNLLD